MAYLIKGAHVYNPDDLGVQDVLVINDKIAAVGKDLNHDDEHDNQHDKQTSVLDRGSCLNHRRDTADLV